MGAAATRGGRAAKLVAIAAAAMVAAGSAALGYSAAFRDRVPPGVRALDVDLGGLRQHEAEARLADRLQATGRPALLLDGTAVPLPAAAFGEPAALAARLSRSAVQLGHEAPFGTLGVAVRAAAGGTTLDAPAADPEALRAAVAALAAAYDRPAVEPRLLLDRDGQGAGLVRLELGQAGRRLDVDRTVADLAAASAAGARTAAAAVDAAVTTVDPVADPARAEAARARAAAGLSQPLSITAGGARVVVERPARLVERVELGAGGEPQAVFDAAALDALAAQIDAAGSRPPQNARLEPRGEEIALVPAVPGAAARTDALGAALAGSLFADSRAVALPVQPVPPAVTTEALAPLRDEANRLVAEPLSVTRGERRLTLARADLARLLALPSTAPEAGAAAGLRLDETRLRAALAAFAQETDRAGADAHLEVRDGAVATVPGEPGDALDLPATAAAVQEALRAAGAARTVAAVTKTTPPPVTEAMLARAKAQAEKIAGAPISVRYGGKTWTLTRADLTGLLLFGASPDGAVPYLSRNRLLAWAQPIADELNPQLEREYAAAQAAWEQRQAERAAAATATATAAATTADAGAVRPASPPPPGSPAADPQPKRQWVDVPATAGAIWAQAPSDARTVDLRLTTSDPAAAPGAGPVPAAVSAAPAEAARGKWIDVNVTTQSLVAYEGDWPVFSALVSTGLPRTPTPVGTYRVFSKLVTDDMRGGSYATGDYYFLPKVPWVMYFLDGGYALHGTYWHSNFGNPMSHGCVNLSPENSKWLFDWTPMGTTVVVHR